MGNTVTSEFETSKMESNKSDYGELNKIQVLAMNIKETIHHNSNLSSKVIFMVIFYVFVCFMGIVTNVITCIVIAKNSTIHSATNYYLISLTISDMMLLISGTFIDLPYVQYEWTPDFSWKQNMCLILPYLYRACYNTSVLTVLTISVERYLAICYPFSFNAFSGLKRSIRFIIGIWTLGFVSACPHLFQTINRLKVTYVSDIKTFEFILDLREYYNCSIDLLSNVYEDTMAILFFLIPMILIVIIHTRIGLKIRSNLKKSTFVDVDKNYSLFRHFQSRSRTMKLLFAVVAANFLCWTPNQIVHILWKLSKFQEYVHMDYSAFNLSFGLSRALFNCSAFINPIIYNIMSTRFRKAFSKTVQSLALKSKPKEEEIRIVAFTIIPE